MPETMKRMKNYGLFILLIPMMWGCKDNKHRPQAPEDDSRWNLSYEQICYMITDLEALSHLPQEGLKTGLLSSYDRNSRYHPQTDSYVLWQANKDFYDFENARMENGYYVLGELEGPGVIWRTWSANPQRGRLKIYIDDKELPSIYLPFKRFFDQSTDAFSYPELVYVTAKGHNLYVPISFNKRIRILAEPGWGSYYQFTYTLFPKGTKVEPFEMLMSPTEKQALDSVNNMLARRGEPPYTDERTEFTGRAFKLMPDSTYTIRLDGPQAIKALLVQPILQPSDTLERALRAISLSVRWDDEEHISVWAPLGDFFGTAPGINPYQTLPMGMKGNTFYSYWYMPFAGSAEISFHNDDKVPYRLVVQLQHERLQDKPGEYNYFHALWRNKEYPMREDRWPDWQLMSAQGTGRYVGTMLSVWNPRGGPCPYFAHPGSIWWGMGDDKIFVDGESFPSIFGTGTDDYFGYAQADTGLFDAGYHAQTMTRNHFQASAVRFHISDNIPFQNNIEACIGKYYPKFWPTQYVSLSYFYLNHSGKDQVGVTPFADRYGFEEAFNLDIDSLQNIKKPGVIEAEDFNIVENSGGETRVYNGTWINIFGLSQDKFLNWYSKPDFDNELRVRVSLPKTGYYNLIANLIRWHKFGIIQFYIDGVKIGAPVDQYTPFENRGKVFSINLGTRKLDAGQHTVSLRFIGHNPEMFGQVPEMAIDYIDFEMIK